MTGDGRKEQSSIVPSPEVLNSGKEESFRLRAVREFAGMSQRRDILVQSDSMIRVPGKL